MGRAVFLIAVGLAGTAILVALGIWQVQRLAWKQDLLTRIETEIAADPVSLGEDLPRYAPVEVSGQFASGHIRMLASRKSIGPVYRVIRPFEADWQGRILIDTGWLREGTPVPDVSSAPVSIVGNVDTPNESDVFTPAPDLDRNIWFAREVPAMAEALGTQPIFVVLRDLPDIDVGVTPWPVDTVGIPNDHLQYAITWFSLAAIWVAMTCYFIWRTRANHEGPEK
ncbi:MAG: SURF1 family protein [Pseudomonadota bacterium]